MTSKIIDRQRRISESGSIDTRTILYGHETDSTEQLPVVLPEEAQEPIPPDGGWAWVVLLGSGISFIIILGFGASFPLIFAYLLQRYGQTTEATAWVPSIHGGVKMFLSPIGGALCNRFGFRKMSIIGALLSTTGLIISAFGPTLLYVYIGHGIIAAFGMNLCIMVVFSVPGRYFEKRKAVAVSISTAVGNLGSMAFPYITKALNDNYGYSGVMFIFGAMYLNLVAFAILYAPIPVSRENRIKTKTENTHTGINNRTERIKSIVRVQPCPEESQEKDRIRTDHVAIEELENIKEVPSEDPVGEKEKMLTLSNGTNCDPEKETAKPTKPSNYDRKQSRISFQSAKIMFSSGWRLAVSHCLVYFDIPLLKKPSFLLFSIYLAGAFFSMTIQSVFVATFSEEELNMTESQVNLLLVVGSGCNTVGRFASGFLFDTKWINKYRGSAFALLGLTSGGLIAAQALVKNIPEYFVTNCLYRFFIGGFHTQHLTVLSDLVGSAKMVSALGLCRVFLGVGVIAGPVTGGALRDKYLTNTVAYLVAGFVMMAFSLLAFIMTLFPSINPLKRCRKRKISHKA